MDDQKRVEGSVGALEIHEEPMSRKEGGEGGMEVDSIWMGTERGSQGRQTNVSDPLQCDTSQTKITASFDNAWRP